MISLSPQCPRVPFKTSREDREFSEIHQHQWDALPLFPPRPPHLYLFSFTLEQPSTGHSEEQQKKAAVRHRGFLVKRNHIQAQAILSWLCKSDINIKNVKPTWPLMFTCYREYYTKYCFHSDTKNFLNAHVFTNWKEGLKNYYICNFLPKGSSVASKSMVFSNFIRIFHCTDEKIEDKKEILYSRSHKTRPLYPELFSSF